MHVDFDPHKNQKGTSKLLFDYLDKENKGLPEEEKDLFFNHERDNISKEEATTTIDNNIAKLGKDEDKYYEFHISPSDHEIEAINGDIDKFKEFVRDVMDAYANNFNKGLTGNDLVYYATVENTRKFKTFDVEVKNGSAKAGEFKQGDQTHAHVVVSRKDKTNKIKLSPKDNAKGGSNFKVPGKGTTIVRGFDRNKFYGTVEKLFDKKFSYERKIEDTFEYKRIQKHHPEEFKKRFGKKATKNILVNSLDSDFSKKEYAEKHINKIAALKKPKDQTDAYFKQRGIKLGPNKIDINGSSMFYNKLNLKKDALDFIYTYYSTNKLGKIFQGKGEKNHEKEKE